MFASAKVMALALGLAANPKAEGRDSLRRTLQEVLERPALKAARVSAQVLSLDTGETILTQRSDDLLNPASNVKLFTAAASLLRLGPEYRFDTEFLSDTNVQGGRIKNLYVRGKGDPFLSTERLYTIVRELSLLGVKEVSGDLVVDDSWFDNERTAPGFDQEDTDRAYMAPTGAVSLNANVAGIYVRPGAREGEPAMVSVEPASDYFKLQNTVSTWNRKNRRFWIKSSGAGEQQQIQVGGVVAAGTVGGWSWKKIDNPPMYFGHTFKALLKERGIKLKGKVKLGLAPANGQLLYVSRSETLDLVLKRLNKNSSNFVAEQLLKALGAEVKGAPGSFDKGIDVVEEVLEKEIGIPRGAYVMRNGSGLNDTNRFSAAQLNRLLKAMYDRFPLAPEYLSSLGIAGKDGTLRFRFEGSEAVGRLRAKTGTLHGITALSGYVQAVSGEKFAFSVVVNDYQGSSGPVLQSIDALGAAVAASGSAEGPDRAVAQVMGRESAVGPMDEAKARLRTYLTFAKQRDSRNVPFLRTAWRTERDPAVRAAVAEALYRNDPDDGLSVRALLDSFVANAEVYGRLRLLSHELAVEVPGFGSVTELAGEGNYEAVQKVLELARFAQDEASGRKEVAEGLSEVARTAPEEIISALKAMAPTDQEAAIGVLGDGLAAAAEAEHPFWPALRKLMGSIEPGMSDFARALDGTLSVRIAQARAPEVMPLTPAAPKPASGAQPERVPNGPPGG